jgi:CrcB protein
VCGGFTTFSTFSLEAVGLIERQQYWQGGLYIVLSVCCCMAGVIVGKKLAMSI